MLLPSEDLSMDKIPEMIDISVESIQQDISALSPLSSKKKLHNQTESIKTFCRIRPFNGVNEVFHIKQDDDKVLMVNTDKLPKNATIQKQINSYTFSKTFGEQSTQAEVFEATCRQLVEDLLYKRKSGLIFTYGMTNAGKTFTVTGTPTAPGILPQSLMFLLENYNRLKTDTVLYCNFVEIYQEDVFDLLANDPSGKNKFFKKKINVKENNRNIFYLSDATFLQLDTIEEFNAILSRGIGKKVLSATNLNQNSSRSHTIFKIILREKDAVYDDPNVIDTSLSIVDLAGSERANRTETSGKELQEACKINQSLSVLGKCLEAMKHNSIYTQKKMVPFRESKLTKLFCEYFQGEQNIIMVTNINPRKEDFEETLRALNYSCIAKEIKPIKSRIINTNNPLRKIIRLNKPRTNDDGKGVTFLPEASARNDQSDLDESTSLALPETVAGNETINQLILEIQKLRSEVCSIKTESTKPQHEPYYQESNHRTVSTNPYTPQMMSPCTSVNNYENMLQRLLTPMIEGNGLDALPMNKMPGVNLFFINSKFNDFHMNKRGLIPEENESEEEDNGFSDEDDDDDYEEDEREARRNKGKKKKKKQQGKQRAKSNKEKPIRKTKKDDNANANAKGHKAKNVKPRARRAKTSGKPTNTPIKRISVPNAYNDNNADTLQSVIELPQHETINIKTTKPYDNNPLFSTEDKSLLLPVIRQENISSTYQQQRKDYFFKTQPRRQFSYFDKF